MLQRLSARQWHQFGMYLLIALTVVLQSVFVARFSSPWLHVDLVTIVLVYMAIEHEILDVVLRGLFAALLLRAFSSAPNAFFIMYYAQILAVATLVARRVVLLSALSQYALFVGLSALKYILFAILAVSLGSYFAFMPFFWSAIPSLIVTSLFAIPGFRFLATIDYRFQVQRGREESGSSFF
jgi:hypothetical protein